MKCANYMNFDAIRETVRQHQEQYGDPDEPPFYDLSDLNITRNCSICDFGGTGSPVIDQVVRILEEDGIKLQELIKGLSGEPLKRVCFKELKANSTPKEFFGMKYPFKECARPKLFKLGRCLECSVRDFCEAKEKLS